MPYFNDPAVRLTLHPLVTMAQEPGFLNRPGSPFVDEVGELIHGTSSAGYDTNPLQPVERTGNTVDWLAERLNLLAQDQNPDSGPALYAAYEAVDTIVSRANKAAQTASIPVALRLAGGLVLSAIQKGGVALSDEAIADIEPNDEGIRLVRGGNLEYLGSLSLRELTNTEMDGSNKWSIDPALLVRTRRFGAVAAEFESDSGTVAFKTQQSPYPGTITIEMSSTRDGQFGQFSYFQGNQVPPYSLDMVREKSGPQLTAIQQASRALLDRYGLKYNAGRSITGMIASRYLLPNPNEQTAPQAIRRRWWPSRRP